MVQFKQLDAKHASYNPGLLARLCVLYKGGYEVQNNADLFIHQLASETPASFEDRKKCAAYLPLMSDTIDYYAAMLFAGEMSVTEAADADDEGTLGDEADDESVYKLFMAAADLRGQSLEEVIRHIMTDALKYGHSFVGVDFPRKGEEELPLTELEEEVTGAARPYLCDVDPECVINWSYNEADKFNWVVLKSDCPVQLDPLDAPMHQIEFKIWKLDNGVAKWELYRSKLLKPGKLPAPTDDIDLVDEGITTFKEIPVLKLCLPAGLALGPKIAPMCENIFQRTTILFNGENKSLNAMRVVFLGEEGNRPGGAPASMVQENPFRHLTLQTDWESKGFGVLGANDKMEIIESQGHAFKIVDEQIDRQIEKVKETVHQMANSAAAVKSSKGQGRSAQAQQESRHSTEILLTAYGNIVRDFIKALMNCISAARGEAIVWTVDGFENFTIIDRAQLIEETKNFPGVIQQSVSQTFKRLYTEKFYLGLLDGASHEEAKQIRREILDATEQMTAQPMQSANGVPPGDPSSPQQAAQQPAGEPGDEGDAPLGLGPAGQPLMPEGAHLQTGEHVDGQVVFDHLATDYNEKDIEWVKHIPWVGPVEVPLSSIDFSNKDNWQATQEEDDVDKFADKMQDGFSKPIVLVNNPSNDNKMEIVDGHHRALAALQNNTPVAAFVGSVGTNRGPWDKLHSKQVGKKEGSGPMQSNQKPNETSVQKEVSQQVKKSEMAKGGKTK